MLHKTKNKPKRGRPVGSGLYDKRLPEIRLSNHQLKTYQNAAKASDQSLSEWIRTALDKATIKTKN